MQISVEVSLYPLADSYLEEIQATVERLGQCEGVKVKTNDMSTQISGEFEDVMRVMQEEIYATFSSSDKAVFVCKFLNKAIAL